MTFPVVRDILPIRDDRSGVARPDRGRMANRPAGSIWHPVHVSQQH